MTENAYRVRKFEIRDLDELFRLRRLLWDGVTATDHQNEILEILANADTDQIFVAETPIGQLCGFLEASIRPFVEDCESDAVGYLEGWFVESQYRQRGIGSRLVREAELWAGTISFLPIAT